MKQYINPDEAWSLLNGGNVIYSETSDGHAKIEKVSSDRYDITLYEGFYQLDSLRGTGKMIQKTLRSKAFINHLYVYIGGE